LMAERRPNARRYITPPTESGTLRFKQVDVSDKPVQYREATAVGSIRLKASTIRLIREGRAEKGDPLSLAKLAGIAASKRTPELVLLCHQLRLEAANVEATLTETGVEVRATVSAHEKTGVEMEALTAAAVALLNVWDVVKQYEKDSKGQYPSTRIEELKVTKKVKRSEGP
jgi:cyclic pyranopterin monophosphate synthase